MTSRCRAEEPRLVVIVTVAMTVTIIVSLIVDSSVGLFFLLAWCGSWGLWRCKSHGIREGCVVRGLHRKGKAQ